MLKSFFVWFLTAVALMLLLSLSVSANAYNLELSPYSEKEQDDILERCSAKLLDTEPKITPIVCFDVRPDGYYALGHTSAEKAVVCVYTPDGSFQYGVSFRAYGNFYVLWSDSAIHILFARGKTVLTVKNNGNCITAAERIGTADLYETDQYVKSPVKEVGNKVYSLENDMVIGYRFGRLCVTNQDEQKMVLYDATKQHLTEFLFYSLLCVGVFLFAILHVIRKEKQKNTDRRILLKQDST